MTINTDPPLRHIHREELERCLKGYRSMVAGLMPIALTALADSPSTKRATIEAWRHLEQSIGQAVPE